MMTLQYTGARQKRQMYTFQQKLQRCQEQLQADFYQFDQLKQQLKKNKISQIQSSTILSEIIQKLTFPIVGIQILRDKLLQVNLFQETSFQILDFVQDKAQKIYQQSIMNDLKRIQNQEIITHATQNQVKNIIQEINWKIDMEKSIHQQQVIQGGQHADLMKFFQGVRNYQNWHQNIKKQTIQHLKQKAHEVQLNLTLKKGFFISKIQKLKITTQKHFQQDFFRKFRQISKIHLIQKFLNKMKQNLLKQSIIKISQQSKLLTNKQKIEFLCTQYWQKKACSNINKEILRFMKFVLKYKLFAKKIQLIFKSKKNLYYGTLIQRINYQRKVRNSQITLALQKINKFTKIKCKKMLFQSLMIPQYKLFKALSYIFNNTLSMSFQQIRKQSNSNIKSTVKLSDKFKGRILMQLKKHQQRPINLRNTFLNWYVKGNETKLSKQIYNIWLTGTTSKFTFFMRLKNLVNQTQNYKIKYELKLFLMVFNGKMNKYINHCQTSILQKWIKKNKDINKLQSSIKVLNKLTNESNEIMKKHSFNKLQQHYKNTIFLQRYCQKYLGKHIQNIKRLIDVWKILPDIKKSKGQVAMRNILIEVVRRIQITKEESFNKFKLNRVQGKNRKVLFLRKMFNQDFIYLQKYFQSWRIKKEVKFQVQKQRAIRLISQLHRVHLQKTKNHILQKFKKNKSHLIRHQKTTKIILSILNRNTHSNSLQVYNEFKKNWNQGKQKKNKLVKLFVNGIKIRQLLAMGLFRNKIKEMVDLDTINKTNQFMSICQQQFKTGFTIFDRTTFTFNLLMKILNNRAKNTHTALKNIQALPNRIDWNKRQKAINFYQALATRTNYRISQSFSKFKQSRYSGHFTKIKCLKIMQTNYLNITKKYFSLYRAKINKLKYDENNSAVFKSFQLINEVVVKNIATVFINQSQWKKKAMFIQKLDVKAKQKIQHVFNMWRQTAKSIAFNIRIKNQKKKRVLEILMNTMNANTTIQSKRAILMFKKNSKITQIQNAFLKRLCDGKAGQVNKAVMIWKNLPQPKNKQRNARATKFESILNKECMKNLKKTFKIFKDVDYLGNQKKRHCIRTLVNKCSSGVKFYFQNWRHNNKLQTLFSQCARVSHLIHTSQNVNQQNFKLIFFGNEASVKRDALHKLNQIKVAQHKIIFSAWRSKTRSDIEFNNKKSELIKRLSQIRNNHQDKNVRDFVIKKFLQFKIIQNLSKQRYKQSRLLQIIDNATIKRKQLLSQSYQIFKFNQIKGNFKKKRAFQNWLKDKISQIHTIYADWNNLAKQKVAQDKRRYIDASFQSMDQLVKSNYSHLITNQKELQLKRKILNQLFRAQQIKLKGFFILWKNHAKQLKILGEMDKQAKTSIIQRLNKIASTGSTQSIRQAIRKFHKSMKIQKVQRKFMNQLLSTKQGMAMEGFKRWKAIPLKNRGQKFKKAAKFMRALQQMHKQRLGFLHKVFKTESEQGNMMKKQSILQLFDQTSTGIRRFYRRWQKMTKQTRTLNSVTQLIKCMDIMQNSLSSQYMIIFQDQRQYEVKIKAINKLIASAQGTSQNYFDKWRSNVKEMKMLQNLDGEKKTTAVALFTKIIEGGQTVVTINAIRKFRKNAIVTDISKKFFKKILQTKAGKAMQLIQAMKNIPDAKMATRKKKAIKFQACLNGIAHKILRESYAPFKTCNYIATDRKKYCITKLVRMSMGQTQKKFLLWRNIVRQDKVLQYSHEITSSFDALQSVFNKHISIIFKDSKEESQKKRNLCRKLTMNSQFVQHHAFLIWKQVLQANNMKIVQREAKVKDVLKNLINIQFNHQKKQATGGFNKFRNVLSIGRLKDFAKKQEIIHKKVYKFHSTIQNMAKNRLSALIMAMKNSSIQQNFVNKSLALQLFFKNSTQLCSQNLIIVMRNQRETVIIENALDRIFRNFKIGTEKAFNIWRQNNRVLKFQQTIGNTKKKNIIDLLTNLLGSNQVVQTKKAIQQFHINMTQTKRQKDILMKILSCKAGKVPMVFMKWKALPSQTAKKYKMKGMKFESVLFRAVNQRMKYVYNQFKLQNYDATVKMQLAIKRLVACCQSDNARMFSKWRTIKNEQKIRQKIGIMQNLFSFTQQNFIQNLQIFSQSKQQNRIKVEALQKIFNIQQSNFRTSLTMWIDETQRHKNYRLSSIFSKYTDYQINKKLVKQSFLLIRQRSQMQSMKGYINSLWKWKLSSLQDNYYDKFVKIMSQSQQMLNLSKILNKKQSQHMHFAYHQIQNASQSTFNRKVQLVQKYMSKKVRTYIDRIRKNVYRQNVTNWKGQFTKSILVQGLCNILTKIIRKQSLKVFNTIINNEKYYIKVESLSNTLNAHIKSNLSSAISNIYRYGFYRIIKSALLCRNKVKQHLLMQGFDSIANFAQTRKVIKTIQKVEKSSMIRYVFNRLKKNSQRMVQQKLSILLISAQLNKKKQERSVKLLNIFRKKIQHKLAVQKMVDNLNRKQLKLMKMFFNISLNDIKIVTLLQRFRKGTALKNILEKQDTKLLKSYFMRLKKKQNPWISQSVRRFATRSSIRSSLAVSLWRLKIYCQK